MGVESGNDRFRQFFGLAFRPWRNLHRRWLHFFLVVSGFQWGIFDDAGNPPSDLEAGVNGAIGIGDTISITRNGGGFFRFDAFDFACSATADPMFGAAINELRLVGASQTSVFLRLDNFVLNPTDPATVPEPATLSLLGLGLAGLGARRWRQREGRSK
jgi:hypothetical protein